MTLKQKLMQKLDEGNAAINIPENEIIDNSQEEVITMDTNNVIQFHKNQVPALQLLPEMQIGIEEARKRLQLLQQFVKEMMIEGQDYGLIPGCPKPSLFKSGAEKLCDIFGFSKTLEIISRLEDWDKGIFSYEVKIKLISKRTGHVEAEGIGSCNSKEKRYKSQDAYTLVNTLLKMAKKRAIVDAVLSATRSSGLFTQDIEVRPDRALFNVV